MIILLGFAFISGLITIFAPCIWPLLPIVLSATTSGGHKKPLGITLGIVTSFTFFTLSLSYILKIIPFDPEILRLFAVVVIGVLGLTLVIPKLSAYLEGVVSKFSQVINQRLQRSGQTQSTGFGSGFITGFALGLIWTPCAGPILATIATLASTQAVNWQIVLVTLAYVTGVGIPLFGFALLGRRIFTKSRLLNKYTGRVQQVFGVIMILTAVAIFTNYDKFLQAKLLDTFPGYANFVVDLESNPNVKQELQQLKNSNQSLFTQPSDSSSVLPVLGKAPDFVGINHWLNSEPLTLSALRGKVVLIDFWTYTCINCIRTLPHITAWDEAYKEQGLVVVGVHTPEFEFEKDTDNVKQAIAQYDIQYPVAQDNDYRTWRAYDNHYWPAHYLIDAQGQVRYISFGEGDYDKIEQAIKDLLLEAGIRNIGNVTNTNVTTETVEGVLTPETYLGSARANQVKTPFTLIGDWDVQSEYIESINDSAVEIQFTAEKVFLVISPQTVNNQIRVVLDGQVIDPTVAGNDIKNGQVQLDMERLYNLVDLKNGAGTHTLRLEFEDSGIKAFAFTFG